MSYAIGRPFINSRPTVVGVLVSCLAAVWMLQACVGLSPMMRIAGALENTGLNYDYQGDHSKALVFLRTALPFLRCSNAPQWCKSWLMMVIARNYAASHDDSNAEIWFQQALDMDKELVDSETRCSILTAAAEFYEDRCRYSESEPIRKQLAKLGKFDCLGHYNSWMDLHSTFNLGFCFASQKKHAEAIEQFEKAIKLCDSEDTGMSARVAYNLADEYHRVGRDAEAIPLFQRSVEPAIKNDINPFGVPSCKIEFAESCIAVGNYNQAERLLVPILLYEEERHKSGWYCPMEFYGCTRTLVSLYTAQGRTAKAGEILKKISDFPLTEECNPKPKSKSKLPY